jgi:xanthosine utilization system XapX-like protein
MDTSKLMPAAIALGICYAVAHFAKSAHVKAAAFGVMGVIVAKQVPYVQDAV